MYRIAILILPIFLFFCNDDESEHSPQVTPEIVSVSASSVAVKWNSAGSEFYYRILISIDSINDNNFLNPIKSVDNIYDTVCVIDSLLSKTYHKLVVLTMGGNKAPNQSWPPLRFKTE